LPATAVCYFRGAQKEEINKMSLLSSGNLVILTLLYGRFAKVGVPFHGLILWQIMQLASSEAYCQRITINNLVYDIPTFSATAGLLYKKANGSFTTIFYFTKLKQTQAQPFARDGLFTQN
jgi:hypothetical protein